MDATRYAMAWYVDTVDRVKGHGLKTTKTHSPLHTEYNLRMFGSHNNSHSGPCESNHIENVKKPSRNTQRQKDTIDDQLCKRLSEKMVLDIATGLVNEAHSRQFPNSGVDSNVSAARATHFALDISSSAATSGVDDTLSLSLRWLSSHKKDHPSIQPEVTALNFLRDLLLHAIDGNTCQIGDTVTFPCFTEYKKGDDIYRAHPDYRKDGPWYDWAYVEFGPDDTGDDGQCYPSQIWYFVDLRNPIEISDQYGEGVDDIRTELCGFSGSGLYAVVTPTDALPVPMVTSNTPKPSRMNAAQKEEWKIRTTSLILKTARRDTRLWLVPVESISSPAMVLDHPGSNSSDADSLIVVTPRMDWPDIFLLLKLL